MTAAVATVVVPTRDRPGSLAACLAALEAQTAEAFEIVVVDDGSSDPGAVAAVVAEAPRARLLRGSGRGPAAARNLGAAAGRAPVICLTDDDCRPGPGWVEGLVAAIAAGARVVAGPTRNGRPGDPFATASQAMTNHLTDTSYEHARGLVGFAPTSNMAMTVDVHRRFPFDDTYPLAAGEDRDWCSRLARAAIAIAFEPAAWVEHHQQLTLGGFWRQQVRYGRGAHRWRRGAGDGERTRQPVRFYVDLLGAGARHGPAVTALVAAAQVATALGMAREAVAVRRSR